MRACLALAVALLGSVGSRAQSLTITPLTGNCYVFTTWKEFKGTPFPANGMYVVTPAGAVLLDMPWDTTQTQPLLDSIAQRHHVKVVMSISTHFHDDRTGAIPSLKAAGVKTYSSAYTRQLCAEKNEAQAEYTFTTDTTFVVGGVTFETFYPGKGHAPDNIVVWLPQSEVLYGGCFVKSTDSKGLGNLGDADVKAWKKSVQRVLNRYPHPAYVVPGHESWTDKNAVQHTRQLLKAAR